MTAMHLKALTVVLMVAALPTIQSCSAPFKLLDNRWCVAVMISNGNASLHSWGPARRDCQSHGGDLIILKDHDKMRAVSDYLDTYVRTRHACWVGGRTVSGVWQWVDGSEMNLQSHLWGPEQPDNNPNEEEYALLVIFEDKRRLVAITDTLVQGHLCEK